MATVKYITPITNRTRADVDYARAHQDDLQNKHIGAWNYTDMNRICNNLKYAAEYMYDQGFLNKPYSLQVKLDWTETDIITYETLNTMIVNNLTNLKTYSRPDLPWFPISSIANMDYSLANWIEKNIDALATQIPIPPDTYTLKIENGIGGGEYEANTVVDIQANPPEKGLLFDHWTGDHLENIGNATASKTTYKMPHQNVTLRANYTSVMPHTLTILTHSGKTESKLSMGENTYIEADPAPFGKVFHHWIVTPKQYEKNLYEPAASTYFTMPNEDVTLQAVYITKGNKQLKVINGTGSGYYEYDTHVSIRSNKPSNGTFTRWSGDTQYLTGPVEQEFNAVKIPDKNLITVYANWSTPPVPPAKNIKLTVEKGVIDSSGATEGAFDQGTQVVIKANPAPEGYKFEYWTCSEGSDYLSNRYSSTATVYIGRVDLTVTATYRQLEYHTLEVTTNTDHRIETKEKYDYFSVNAGRAPDGQTFDKWTGDTHSFNDSYGYNHFDIHEKQTGTYMGATDRKITATYRPITDHTLTIKQPSGDVTYTQQEFTNIEVVADPAPEGMKFTYWSLTGAGRLSSTQNETAVFTFGNGDTTITPRYSNVWNITVENGTLDGKSSGLFYEGRTYDLRLDRSLEVYERFDGWNITGPGTIKNTASIYTTFTVGAGDATIRPSITQYPDKTLSIYWRHPDTGADTLVSQKTYQYGSRISDIKAHIAPNKSTFLTWIGDVDLLHPSALASTITIPHLTADTTITATYFYPEAPKYYTLTVYKGNPKSGSYAAGSQVAIRADRPGQDWEFYKWYGDTQYLVNPDLTQSENSVIMPLKSISLYAKFKVKGELPLYRVSVENGIASGTYTDSRGNEHKESGVYIDVPAKTEVTLTADPDTVGWVFDYWEGNFAAAGVTDIVKTNNPTLFTMPESDINVVMQRRELEKYTVYPKDATGPGNVYPGTYPISGALKDTDICKYTFVEWKCYDADHADCISAIEDPKLENTNIKITDKDLWIEAIYDPYYKLTVIKGTDSGTGFYKPDSIVSSVIADIPTEGSRLIFDHWDDPMKVIKNIYDPTPTIIMKNNVATITAIYTSLDANGNSVIITGDDIDDQLITRHDSYLINGVYAVGAIVFDKNGSVGFISQIDPDNTDDTDDYKIDKLFYGGEL